MAEEESLHEWVARRDRRRAAEREMTGTRRAVPLADGARASHVAPDAPRALLEWDGHAWVTVGVASNADAAREFLGHLATPAPENEPDGRPAHPGLGPGRGRHRKP
ncbi:DUF6087 family protein [Streptomyces sp. VNUA24]|uniref:DUF6087 family protein n=1 Tax=Streptomyces sp. VNUA24 TaxID=3031131 RepID=UPI0023B7E0B1|nr:DUF6087 family protein [Streptomyces sp. VNUA24]WEH18277.1 DUF6087 family protein [Streptomyces sp. VNUA24]